MDLEANVRKNAPIGFMDSGLGGLSVLREAVRLMPSENYIYYGDSLHAPYGTKSTEKIRELTGNVVDYLLERGIKGLAVACNTATSASVRLLRTQYPELPIVGIEPAVKPAAEENHGGRVIVLATPMTIKQPKFHYLLDRFRDQAEIVPVSCAGLMEFVERGELEGSHLDQYFEEHLSPYIVPSTETIVLGCTHYPFLKKELKKFIGKDSHIKLIDGSEGTARELKRRLGEAGLLTDRTGKGQVEILNSASDPQLINLSWRLLNLPSED